jgi:hypothetical protein
VNALNHTLNNIERGFNVAGSIPFVGAWSGLARAPLGQAQFITGIALSVVGLIGSKVSNNNLHWKKITQIGVEHILHGLLNTIRGIVEFILGITLMGSFVMLLPNLINEDKFSPFFKYGSLEQPVKTRTI